MDRKNAFYAQSGGVTAVINATACGVIETARRHADRIGTVYAGRHGISVIIAAANAGSVILPISPAKL